MCGWVEIGQPLCPFFPFDYHTYIHTHTQKDEMGALINRRHASLKITQSVKEVPVSWIYVGLK